MRKLLAGLICICFSISTAYAGLAFPGAVVLTGTSSAIGGSSLTVGVCTSGTATVTGAAVGMAVAATPNTYPGDGVFWHGYVSSANTVTVVICGVVIITPASSTYNVRVMP